LAGIYGTETKISMKIGVAQTKPVKGDIAQNIAAHIRLIDLAATHGAGTIIFPELSVIGYEPELAKDLVTDKDDSRFDELQKISDEKNITIGAGMPLQGDKSIYIGMVIFQPRKERQTYLKQWVHADEVPYFVNGPRQMPLMADKISLAICYESSLPVHSEDAAASGAEIYIASVAKTADGVAKAMQYLPEIARKHSMIVLFSNCVGPSDNFIAAGKSAVWNEKGELLAQLDGENEGIILIDTVTKAVISKN
jgi:predicted amidohydrolase